MGGRQEGGRKEGGREGEVEGKKEGGREGRREGGREGRREGGSYNLTPNTHTVQEDLLARTLFWRLAICSIFRQYLKRQQNIYGMTH